MSSNPKEFRIHVEYDYTVRNDTQVVLSIDELRNAGFRGAEDAFEVDQFLEKLSNDATKALFGRGFQDPELLVQFTEVI